MKKIKKVVEAQAPVPVECVTCEHYKTEIIKLQQTNTEYKKAFDTVKMKLQTIFNITQL